MSGPVLSALCVADPPERWRALGFHIAQDELILPGVRVRLGGEGTGITGWSIAGLPPGAAEDRGHVDGLRTTSAARLPAPSSSGAHTGSPLSAPSHPNGAIALDHVVVASPDFDRTAQAFAEAGMSLTRVRDAGSVRQGFRRIGPVILELVEAPRMPSGPAHFWGLVVIVPDLESLTESLGPERLGRPKAAVQPGRQIATLKREAGLSSHVAFMTPEVR